MRFILTSVCSALWSHNLWCSVLRRARVSDQRGYSPAGDALTPPAVFLFSQEPERQYMHIGTMVEFAFALVAKLDAINKHSFNDFKLRVGTLCRRVGCGGGVE